MLKVRDDVDIEHETGTDDDDAVHCAGCGFVVTRGRWRIAMNGSHEHTFFNPAGHLFRVVCFREAPGAATAGEPTDEFTWFPGYDWRFALCRGCGRHIGWQYAGDASPRLFFGLIRPRLADRPPG